MNIPFGLWSSPIHWEALSSPPLTFLELQAEGETVYWIEVRPQEKGRHALMCFNPKEGIQEKFPFMNVQTRVHEYGGGAFCAKEGILIVFDAQKGALYLENEQGELILLVQEANKRFADFSFSPDKQKIICVCEDHADETKVANYLVLIDVPTKTWLELESGSDFYASPRFSPDGKEIAFLSWNFPSMPWDECRLAVLLLNQDFQVSDRFFIGDKGESIAQFIWVNPKEIILASDRNGFWNLYHLQDRQTTLLHARQADFAGPLWTLGKSSFALCDFQGSLALVCLFCEKAVDSIAILTLEKREFHILPLPYCAVRTVAVGAWDKVYFIGGTQTQPLSLIELDLKSFSDRSIRESFALSMDLLPFIAMPQAVTACSSLDSKPIYGFYYPPQNPFCAAKEGDRPPLLIRCHSGPTFHASPLLSLELQFWTSRGFAVLDVNYRGSTGYGKEYRDGLKGQWGVVDVQDCRDLADYLVSLDRVNPQGLFVKGGSSGGFTALLMAALGGIKGCVSYYGVTDLSLLMQDTHKFEKGYLDFLVGDSLTSKEIYKERSPVAHSEKIVCPVLFFHGENDRIVPLNQAEALCKQLKHGQIVIFKEEGHSFKQASTIQKCLGFEWEFYLDLLGLRQDKPI